MNNDVIIYKDGELELPVEVTPDVLELDSKVPLNR